MEAVAPSNVAQRTVTVVENVAVAHDTYRIRLENEALAAAIRPGQFVMVRPARGTDPLLGRPFALYDVVRDAGGRPWAVDVVYLVLGKGTAALAERRPGDRLDLWGPLGNGFGPIDRPGGDALFVAGGIGQTPFLALGRWWLGQAEYAGEASLSCRSATLLHGVRTAAFAAGVDDFRAAGIPVELATDDGSAGHHGYVTDLLARRLQAGPTPPRIVACGPAPMLRAVSKLVAAHGLDCELSLENHMACGFGACFSCVTPILQPDGTTDLRRVCVEGPIFPASTVVWDAASH